MPIDDALNELVVPPKTLRGILYMPFKNHKAKYSKVVKEIPINYLHKPAKEFVEYMFDENTTFFMDENARQNICLFWGTKEIKFAEFLQRFNNKIISSLKYEADKNLIYFVNIREAEVNKLVITAELYIKLIEEN
jgi:hypothetical protein